MKTSVRRAVRESASSAFSAALELRFGDRQVTVEREPLALESRGHQGEEDRRGADERPNADARLMGPAHERRPGVGDAGRARLGEHRSARPGA